MMPAKIRNSESYNVEQSQRKTFLGQVLYYLQPVLSEIAASEFYGPDRRHIVTYSPEKMRVYLSPFTSSNVTVCNNISAWFNHILMLIYALLIMVILGFNAFPGGARGDGNACANSANHNVCNLNGILESARDEFRFLIAFVLSSYVGANVIIWMDRRKRYHDLTSNAKNMLIQLSSMLPRNPSDERLSNIRKTMARWVLLALELSVLKARGHMDTEDGRSYLTHQNLLKEGEWEAMVDGNRHTTVFYWIQHQSVQLNEQGLLPMEYVSAFAAALEPMRSTANDLMSHLDQDQPFPYSALCGLLVQVNVFLNSTWKGVQWSIWVHSSGSRIGEESRLWVDMLVLLTWNVSYAALYDLGYLLQNPFGHRRIDVPHGPMMDRLQQLAAEITDDTLKTTPPTLDLGQELREKVFAFNSDSNRDAGVGGGSANGAGGFSSNRIRRIRSSEFCKKCGNNMTSTAAAAASPTAN